MGFLPCPTTRLNNLTVRFQGRADYRQPPDPTEAQVGGRYRRPVCRRARGQGCGGGAGPSLLGASVAWCSRPGGADHGSLTLSPPGSSGPGHRILLVTETHCPPVPRLRTHGDGCAPGTTGGDPRSLTACWHRWRCCTSWVPHSHGLGRWWQVEGSQGALSASLPWDLPGKVPGCGAVAPLVLGARRAHHRTGPSKGRGGWRAGVGRWLSGLQGSPTTALQCTGLCWPRRLS